VAHKVVFRAAAAADLTALYDYIASHSSPEIAIGYVRRIQEACLGLATFPKRGHRRDDILPGLRVVGFERSLMGRHRVSTPARRMAGSSSWSSRAQWPCSPPSASRHAK
jgi:toxin ParE1/3/4